MIAEETDQSAGGDDVLRPDPFFGTDAVRYQSQAASPSDNSGAPPKRLRRTRHNCKPSLRRSRSIPDALVAQILTAATFPDQIAIAAYWVEQNKSLTGSALVSAVNAQTWDPSVKALTQFPSVLSNMSQNLSWTSQLGEDLPQPAG